MIDLKRYKRFLELTATAVSIRDSDAPWTLKHSFIFEQIHTEIAGIGLQPKFLEPTEESSEEEDVREYVRALVDSSEGIRSLLDAIGKVSRKDKELWSE